MDCSNALDRLIEYLLSRKPTEPAVPDEIVPDVIGHIAGCRACIEELDIISSVLTGRPSTLKAEADQLLTCQECLDSLGAYVEDQMAGESVARLYPRVRGHLCGCSSCREQYEMLYEIMRQEKAGVFGEPPSYMTFEEWFRKTTLWKQLTQNLHRLVTDIPIMIGRATASFGQLPSPLVPQPVLVGVYRKKELIPMVEEGEKLVELLELPHPEANLVIKIHLGPVFDGKGILVLEVGTTAPPQPIAQAKVTLRDEDGGLLEGTSTDDDGLAHFRELDIGKYIIQVEHTGQTWELYVTLARPPEALSK